MRNCGAIVALLAWGVSSACTTVDGAGPPPGTEIDAGKSDDPTPTDVASRDVDGDGLEDADEQQMAEAYLPFISLDPSDGCPRSALVARIRKHPEDPTKISIIYSHLFERDCGVNGHIGDNEAFGIAIDPTKPAPQGLLAMRTASHQSTLCERVTECSTCGDSRKPCDLAADGGAMWPVLYPSKGKHGQYARKQDCSLSCFDQCTLAPTRTRPQILNVGEPGKPLVTDLTASGLITSSGGWTEASVMNYQVWGTAQFGTAGVVSEDLDDATFVPAACP